MLVLSRECESAVWIGPNVRVKVLSILKRRVKLGIEAPAGIQIWRDEIVAGSESARIVLEEPAERTVPGGGNSILLVEDDPDHAELIGRTLADVCLAIPALAESGTAALQVLEDAANGRARSALPRLVILDLRLPDMSGLEVLGHIRATAELKTLPVVVLSAEQSDSVVADCLEAGANAFVTKAGDLNQFRNSIRRLGEFWGGESRFPAASGIDRSFRPAGAK